MRARGRTPPSPGRFLATDARAGDWRKNVDATVTVDAVAEVGGVEIEWRGDARHHEPDRGDAKDQLGVVGIRGHVSEEKKASGPLIPQGPESVFVSVVGALGNQRRRPCRPGNESLDGLCSAVLPFHPLPRGRCVVVFE